MPLAGTGGVWIATPNGICSVDRDALSCGIVSVPVGPPGGTRESNPVSVTEDSEGALWIGTRGSSLFKTGAALQRLTVCAPADCLASSDITALSPSAGGGLWIGFSSGTIAYFRDGRVSHYTSADGLPPLPVLAMREDREGSLWAVHENGGLSRLLAKRVTMYSTAEGLPWPVITSVVEDAAGTMWAGADCGPLAMLRDGRFAPAFTEHIGTACANTVLPTRDGSLWIGTRHNGLYRWDGSRMHHYGAAEGLSHLHVNALFEDRDGVLWIGTNGGGLHRFENGRLSRSYDEADGVATGFLGTIAQDHDGRVWIGSNANGLTVYENGRFRRLTEEENPPSRNVSGLRVDSRGDLWIGTADRGLFRRRHGRYEPFGRDQGLGDSLVALMIEDASANLWVATARGIVRLPRDQIEAVAEGRQSRVFGSVIDRSTGLLNAEGSGGGFDPSGLRSRDGRLWFSTIDGIAVIDPATFHVNSVEPPVVVESVRVDERPLALLPGGGVRVPAGTESLEIAYTALSLLEPGRVEFRYRLAGFEERWHDAGPRRAAYFSRLPPGAYTFEVSAANNDGIWSRTPASLAVTVLPFWWERRSVQAAALLTLLVLAGGLVRSVSLRRARQRVAALEREQSLYRERARIARDLHDELGSRLTHIAHLADRLVAADGATPLARAVRDTAQTMDELVWAVNARNDTVEGFAQYLADFAQEVGDAAGLRCRLQIPAAPDVRVLEADKRRHLFLGCKEAITNAVKHADGSELAVRVIASHGRLHVEIADNGRGFSAPPPMSTGNGLRHLRERMAAIGGAVDVRSAVGTGTTVTLSVPLT